MSANQEKSISLGLINFTNCLPVNYALYQEANSRLVISEGYPTLVNQLMYDGQIHASPISSIEYLKNKDKYTLMDKCISSDGDVASVMLFSNIPIEELEGKTIGIPYTSSSSIALLKVLLNEYKLDLNNIIFKIHKYKESLIGALNEKYDAVLYIGDPALIANIKHSSRFLTYDLGGLWKNFTGYPMTFGTWVASSEWKSSNQDDFEWLTFILNKAVEAGMNMYFNNAVNIASKKLNLDKIYIEDYLLNKIKYNLTEEHKKGLELFDTKYKVILSLKGIEFND